MKLQEKMKSNFRPSNTERFLNCNLSFLLPQKEKTEKQIAYLQERSKDHERLAKEEFLESEKNCREFFRAISEACEGDRFKEKKLKIDIKGFVFEGTPDFFGYDYKRKCLYIIDYKTGYQVFESWENKQLLSYACMVFLNKQFDWDIDTFCLSILNTQKDLVSSYYPSKETVLNHIARIERCLSFTKDENTFFAMKGKWCQFCPSKLYCPVHRDISEMKNYMDEDTDSLIYAKEKRRKEISERIHELKQEEGMSEVFDYTLAKKNRFKYREDAPNDLLAPKRITPIEAKNILDKITFERYFEEEEMNILSIGEKKVIV